MRKQTIKTSNCASDYHHFHKTWSKCWRSQFRQTVNAHLNGEWSKTAIKGIVLAELISVIVSGVPTAAATRENPDDG